MLRASSRLRRASARPPRRDTPESARVIGEGSISADRGGAPARDPTDPEVDRGAGNVRKGSLSRSSSGRSVCSSRSARLDSADGRRAFEQRALVREHVLVAVVVALDRARPLREQVAATVRRDQPRRQAALALVQPEALALLRRGDARVARLQLDSRRGQRRGAHRPGVAEPAHQRHRAGRRGLVAAERAPLQRWRDPTRTAPVTIARSRICAR